MNVESAITRPRAGRPTREQAEARHLELLDRALDHFLEKGYEQATIEAIAADVGMTKRTVYARYPEKRLLFLAAVSRAIDRYAVPDEAIRATEVDELEQTLVNIAMLRIDLVATEQGQKLQRVINTESYRFPEIFGEMFDRGAKPTIDFLAGVLDRATRAGVLDLDDCTTAASAFMSLVVSGPVRFILAASPLSPNETETRVRYGVRLFLNGARTRE
jgi:AcrR family transcriptional regulator